MPIFLTGKIFDPPCGGAAQGIEHSVMRVSTEQFDYEFIPARTRASTSPLMIVLHGRGDSLKPFRGFAQELGISQINLLLLNAPRRYAGGYTWYAFPPNQARGVLEARSRLTFLMDELEEQGIPSSRVFLFGFSQGCLVSCDFGLHYDKPLAGIIGVSGYLYFFDGWHRRIPRAAFKTPWLLTHGTRDEALDIDVTRQQVAQLKSRGLPVNWCEYDKDHEIDEVREIPRIRDFIRTQSKARPRRTERELTF